MPFIVSSHDTPCFLQVGSVGQLLALNQVEGHSLILLQYCLSFANAASRDSRSGRVGNGYLGCSIVGLGREGVQRGAHNHLKCVRWHMP
ncbi:uncharacterized protein MYCFIDRAFT_175809 [Pseudocercospora fijiensis CIRAD86]|uniref:Uncharacterized protein n=1 Tax=Pseudocercospora fijiensis (strain CIRAD86) TaxID=383855 RepID=M2ZTC2_PSEFD|nr:uncharacterized protein MYCFIDRAFT_175809 [Pseudocercospora fijiensis CIRAD86]EME82259.1 hypothetical protein MYCFIDRAFT_175809 [Pseudocercospora fijiensis CIRAD86]